LQKASWKTDRPFDEQHYPWEPAPPSPPAAAAPVVAPAAVGHTQAVPAEPVVTTAVSTVESVTLPVKPAAPQGASRPRIDFAFLRAQVSLEQVLRHLSVFAGLRGRLPQLRGCCPVHDPAGTQARTFSVHLGKNVFQCFQAECGAQGNVLDLWAKVQGLPLYEAALHLAETFGLRRNREEEPVKGTV
jgi:CHC2 zinc finger